MAGREADTGLSGERTATQMGEEGLAREAREYRGSAR